MKIKYSPDSRERLKQLRKSNGGKVVSIIMQSVRKLSAAPYRCPSVENVLGIPSPYYFLHVEHFYVFYRVDKGAVYIAELYHEREDFMWKMFGLKLRTQESQDYWGD